MRTWILIAAGACLAACSGGGEMARPNPPPVWPMEGVTPEDLPTGEDVRSPTAPPQMDDTDAPSQVTDPAKPADEPGSEPAEPAEPPTESN